MSEFPLDPQLAKMVVAAAEFRSLISAMQSTSTGALPGLPCLLPPFCWLLQQTWAAALQHRPGTARAL